VCPCAKWRSTGRVRDHDKVIALSDETFRWVAVAVAVGLLCGGLFLRFDYEPRLPHRPPRPPPQDTMAAFRALDWDPNVYRAGVERDAAELGLPAQAVDELTRLFPYDVAEPHKTLRIGGAGVETRDLALALRGERMTARQNQGLVVTRHVVLRITNRTDGFIAYRVETRPPIDPFVCHEKGDLKHNALALGPRETVERTECGREGVDTVTVERVETLALPALGYHYVSRLFPAHIGLDPRATRGHEVKSGKVCADIPEQTIRLAMEKGAVSWRDVVDFYARHPCARYIFHEQYRAFAKAKERPLPSAPGAAVARP
jgi:hypothetical protein